MITRALFTQMRIEIELQIRSLLVIFIVFGFLSITSLFTQFFLPEIIELSGFEIVNLPEPSLQAAFNDVWADFLFTGAIVVIFIGSTSISQYFGVDKPIYFMMSRPLSRDDYYFARSLVRGIGLLGIVFATSLLVYIIGSVVFSPIDIMIVIASSLVLGLALTSFFFILQMINTRLETLPTVGIGIIVIVVMTLMGLLGAYIDVLTWFSPFSLSRIWSDFLNEEDFSKFWINSLVLLIWNAIPLYLGSLLFQSRDM